MTEPARDIGMDEVEKQVHDRLTALNANRECPICKFDKWYLVNEPDKPTYLVASFGLSYPAYTHFCGRCGYVQQFISEILDGKLIYPGVKSNGE